MEVRILDIYYTELPEVGDFIPEFLIQVGTKDPKWINLKEIEEGESYIFSLHKLNKELILRQALEYFNKNREKYDNLVKKAIKFRKEEGEELKKFVERVEASLNKVKSLIENRKVKVRIQFITINEEPIRNHKIENEEFDELSVNMQDLQLKAGQEIGEPPISYWNNEYITQEGEFLYEEFSKEIKEIENWLRKIKKKHYIE